MTTSLYIHIPFCVAKCNYCSFNSYAGLEGLRRRYVGALGVECDERTSQGQLKPLRTVFLGGGTPTLLTTDLLRRLFSRIAQRFTMAEDAEISIEANPGTVDREKLEALKKLGVNRLSIGVQSFINAELSAIARIHSADEARQAVMAARSAGFDNISIDLMYGLPQQSPKSWQESLETALSLDVQHLSLYQLTVEEATPLEGLISSGTLVLPDEDAIADMEDITSAFTEERGLLQYEISNYARDGFQSQHNINYWQNEEYYGIGAGAVQYLDGRRIKNISSPESYCQLLETGQSVHFESECLEREASFRESVIMGLRMNRGVSLKSLRERHEIDFEKLYGKSVQSLFDRKLLERKTDYIRLTKLGRTFANIVMAELL